MDIDWRKRLDQITITADLNNAGSPCHKSTLKKFSMHVSTTLAIETPIDAAPLLSQRLNNEIVTKREDLQPVFSFKLRGAYNKLRQLSKEQLAAGVIAASAGNHAQGLALGC